MFHRFRLSVVVGSLLASLVFASFGLGNAAPPLPGAGWRTIDERLIASGAQRQITPAAYRTVQTDFVAFVQQLRSAPPENTAQPPLEITLPMPDGRNARFRVVEAPIMQSGLATRYPDIKTYLGQGIDDPTATVRLDHTPAGLHAMIIAADATVFIDPYSAGDTTHYLSYHKRDYQPLPTGLAQPYEEIEVDRSTAPRFVPFVDGRSSGQTLRTYRLVVGATGEYTQFQGGTVAKALAAIVTTMNRVVGVYEREVAIRMLLIDSTDQVIFTNPTLDPYQNDDGTVLLFQNQVVIDGVIGDANYDIGHVFSTGGGGVAGLGVVCATAAKARGVTGRGMPVGDPFDIDYVAHEMGHQFGGNHTFNGETRSCGGGNRNQDTSFEPGSGSTIMAYAGICGVEDLQPNSDPYFHTGSFDEIVAYTTEDTGNTCGTQTPTGNAAPVVNAGPDYVVPKASPFTLTGSATDANNDALTYDWEQFDAGAAAPPNTDDGTRAIFRSFNPTLSPSRTFPKLENVLNNGNEPSFGEALATTSRTLTFRLTARDNRAGGGGVSYDTKLITVTNAAGPFVVTAPNTNVTWVAGEQQTVTWDVANTQASPVSCANVNVLLSTNGGLTFATALATNTPNDGSEAITVPAAQTDLARVQVVCATNIFFDVSDRNFRIVQDVNAPTSTPVPATATATATATTDNEPTRQPPLMTPLATGTTAAETTATIATTATTATAAATTATTVATMPTGTATTVATTPSAVTPTPTTGQGRQLRVFLPLVQR